MRTALQVAMDAVEQAMTEEAKNVRPTIEIRPNMQTPGQIINERAHTHGDYNETAKIAQAFKMVIRDRGDRLSSVQRESLEMVATKIARILAGDPNAAEHWNDIAGYALLAAQRI